MKCSRNSFRIHFSFIALVTVLLIGRLAAAQDVGYRDFSYPKNTGQNSRPTGEKPESKLWFNDGWWGILWSGDAKTGAYHIYSLTVNQTWQETTTVVDARLNSRADVLWDGTNLYVVSHIFTTTGQSVAACDPAQPLKCERSQLYRFSYDPLARTYYLDSGFPVEVTGGKSETLVLAKDSTGRLWVTYVQDFRVMVNHSLDNDQTWATPVVLPGANAGALDKDDIASIIAYDGRVGIMWSRQTYNNLTQPTKLPNPRSGREEGDSDHLASITMNFAVHVDGADASAWASDSIYSSSGDDHINLKAYDGYVYAAFKEAGNAKVIGLLTCESRISSCAKKSDWRHYPTYKTGDNDGNSPQSDVLAESYPNPTRPTLLIDTENRDLYIFVSVEQFGVSAIRYKKTKLDAIDFDPKDPGLPFIQNAVDIQIDDPTSTKQNVDSTTGLAVLACDRGTRVYLHNFLALTKP
jgi:hypothetical protein